MTPIDLNPLIWMIGAVVALVLLISASGTTYVRVQRSRTDSAEGVVRVIADAVASFVANRQPTTPPKVDEE